MTAGALVVGYGLSKFAGNTPKKYEIVRSMNRRSLKEVCKRAEDLGFGNYNSIKNVKYIYLFALKMWNINNLHSKRRFDVFC